MPTLVTTARQCLTPEAAHALDEAVTVAHRRGHGQTTSLHAVSALLSLQPSALRDACARARNSSYSPRFQFKALELCLSVSLDRVPTSQLSDDSPPVSNSLMAAIKRSQANQRRQPENFHLYHQITQQQQHSASSSAVSCVKVELQNLILSILDDPVVSRVFAEAGFRSSEVKLAIVRPLPHVFKFSSSSRLPLFLCNLGSESNWEGGRRGFNFPFSGYEIGDERESFCRRLRGVLMRNKGRNPIVVGLCSYDRVESFTEMVEKRKESVLGVELYGLSVVCIENDLRKFVSENCDKGCVDKRFEEVGQLVKQSLGPGLVLNFGDLKAFVNNNTNSNTDSSISDAASDGVGYVVKKLTRLLQLHGRKVWFIGAAASYEIYLKFVSRFPCIEKDWDMQPLHITYPGTPMAESCTRSSLMESFVPFGGFFSIPPDLSGPLSSSCQSMLRCHLCNEKCEQEILAISKRRFTASVADQYQSSLPSWLQMTELGTNMGLDVKTRDDGMVLSTKVGGLQRKWDSICQCLQHTQPHGCKIHPQSPTIVGFRLVDDKKEDSESHGRNNSNVPPKEDKCGNVNSCIPIALQNMSIKQPSVTFPVISEAKTESMVSKDWEKPSKERLGSGGLRSHSFSNSSMVDDSPACMASATSVTTDLGLIINPIPTSHEPKELENQNLLDLSSSFSENNDMINGGISDHPAQSSLTSSPDFDGQFDLSDFKMLCRAITKRVGWQDEAVRVISQTIAHCRKRNEKREEARLRGDIWLTFLGPDKCGKMKIAAALAEIIYGSKENFIAADLSPQDGMMHTYMRLDHQEVIGYDVTFRGKLVLDYVAGELCKKPLSVVFLENVDKADFHDQKRLSQAIRTGKLSDSYGREVSINNAIFIATSTFRGDKVPSSIKDFSNYFEERILRVKGWPMQILVEQVPGSNIGQNLTLLVTTEEGPSGSTFVNKRKLVGTDQNLEWLEIPEMMKRAQKTSIRNLDLNLPAEGDDLQGVNDGNYDDDSPCDKQNPWLQDFFDQVDGKVVFRPFDFGPLYKKIVSHINDAFHKIIGSDCLLDIDPNIMEQLLAAAYLSNHNRAVEDWVGQVLSWGFVEVRKRYNVGAHAIVKLVACKGLFYEEHTPGVQLPPKIIFK